MVATTAHELQAVRRDEVLPDRAALALVASDARNQVG